MWPEWDTLAEGRGRFIGGHRAAQSGPRFVLQNLWKMLLHKKAVAIRLASQITNGHDLRWVEEMLVLRRTQSHVRFRPRCTKGRATLLARLDGLEREPQCKSGP